MSLFHLVAFQAILKVALAGGFLFGAAGLLLRRWWRLSLVLAVAGSAVFIFGYAAFAQPSRLFGSILGRGESANEVALTFDDGPDPRYTPAVLDLLKRWNARATFFVLGKEVEAHSELARRIVAEGHALGSHGYSHTLLAFLSASRTWEELERADQAIQAATGSRPKLLRPPYGFRNPWLPAQVKRLGYRMVGWSLSGRDSQHPTAAQIRRRIEGRLRPGDIVLLHDGRGNREQTVLALQEVLRFLERKGWRAVTVPELLAPG